jgi:drug/metabolite transporter (DMT)-like permease
VENGYLRGLLITAAGILILTPDGLLIKLTGAMGPIEGAFLRSVFMAISWAVMLKVSRGSLIASLRSISKVGLMAAVLLTIDRYFFVAAVQTTTVANTLLIFAAVPAFTAILSYFVLKERCGVGSSIAIAASLAGVVIICGGELDPSRITGNIYALGSALFYTVYLVCLRFTKKDEVLESLCLSGVFGAITALPFINVAAVPDGGLGIIALQGLVLLPAGFALYFSGTRYLPAAEVALIGLLETVLAPVWAWAFIGEMPSGHALIGGGIVLLAILGQALFGLYQQRSSEAQPLQPALELPVAVPSGE